MSQWCWSLEIQIPQSAPLNSVVDAEPGACPCTTIQDSACVCVCVYCILVLIARNTHAHAVLTRTHPDVCVCVYVCVYVDIVCVRVRKNQTLVNPQTLRLPDVPGTRGNRPGSVLGTVPLLA